MATVKKPYRELKGQFLAFKDEASDGGNLVRREMAELWVKRGKYWSERERKFLKTKTVNTKSGNVEESTGKEVVKVVDGVLIYWCPGCAKEHRLSMKSPNPRNRYTWNGDRERPTISPDVFDVNEPLCHHYIQDGRIQYLSITEHYLAGSTVPMQPNRK